MAERFHAAGRAVGGADQIRQYHPSVLILDEAAFLSDFEESYAAADPVAAQIIAVSSAAARYFGDVCTQALEAGE